MDEFWFQRPSCVCSAFVASLTFFRLCCVAGTNQTSIDYFRCSSKCPFKVSLKAFTIPTCLKFSVEQVRTIVIKVQDST